MILVFQNDLKMGKVEVAEHVLRLLFLPTSKYKEETLNCSNNGNTVAPKVVVKASDEEIPSVLLTHAKMLRLTVLLF